MARARGKIQLQPDELVERSAGDPDAPADSHPLAGFLGRGTEGGRWRLYETPALDSYHEFDEADVVHTTKREGDLGGSIVWLKREAQLKYTVLTSAAAQGSFLQGPIASTATQAGPQTGAIPWTIYWPTRSACVDCTWGPCQSWGICGGGGGSFGFVCTFRCPVGSRVCGAGDPGPMVEMMPATRRAESCVGDCVPASFIVPCHR